MSERREVWSYEHDTSSLSGEETSSILLVFLHEGRYDGHLFFSGKSLLEFPR